MHEGHMHRMSRGGYDDKDDDDDQDHDDDQAMAMMMKMAIMKNDEMMIFHNASEHLPVCFRAAGLSLQLFELPSLF